LTVVAPTIRLASSATPGDWAALASIVDGNFAAVKSKLTTHTHLAGTISAPSGGGTCAGETKESANAEPSLNPTKSSTVKID
jgi:hypothetical protein